MDLVDSVEAGKLTISELIDALAKDKNYSASKWDQRYREFTTLLQQTSTFSEPETDGLVKRLCMNAITVLPVFARAFHP
ncbi:restriction endonuclease (plasmid) [Escherichia coli]|nr:restriction endonuclease [Escherichia coli]